MPKDNEGPTRYIAKANEEAKRYFYEILKENERLRLQLAGRENELELRGEEFEKARSLVHQNKNLQQMNYLLEEQMTNLKRQNLALTEEAARLGKELAHLQRQLTQIETENREFSEQFAFIEQHNNNLMNLYVTSYRIHETLERDEVLAAINETIINLVGSEEFVVYELNSGGGTLRLVSSFGVDEEKFRTAPLGEGPIGEAAARGETLAAPPEGPSNGLPDGKRLVAFVPLKLNGELSGAIAIFSLLPQKKDFEELDLEIFDLLATHAATALYCTRPGEETVS